MFDLLKILWGINGYWNSWIKIFEEGGREVLGMRMIVWMIVIEKIRDVWSFVFWGN